jgi:hypothetical protein
LPGFFVFWVLGIGRFICKAGKQGIYAGKRSKLAGGGFIFAGKIKEVTKMHT